MGIKIRNKNKDPVRKQQTSIRHLKTLIFL